MPPPPVVTSQWICAPSTPRPRPSATVTTRGCASGCPATPECSSPEKIARPGGSRPTGSRQLLSKTVLSSIATMESGRQCVIRGRLPNCLTGDHREPKPTSARRPLSTCSTTVLTPSGSGTVARQPQLRNATLGSIQIRSTSPDRTAACTGGSLYPVAAATSRNTSIPETSHPDPRFVTRPEGPEAARTVAATTSLT